MAITAHVYQIYIAATPEEVWRGITDSEWTKRYFHGTSFKTLLETGQAARGLVSARPRAALWTPRHPPRGEG